MSPDAPTVAGSTGSPTSALKVRRLRFRTAWSTPTTSASAERLVSIRRRRAPSAIAAPRPKCQMLSSVCWGDILSTVNRAKICAGSSFGTATQSCASSWPVRSWLQWPVICPIRLGAWRNQQEESVTSLFPMFLKMEGRPCLVLGAGRVGEPKIGGLLETGARIRVVALDASPTVREWARAGKIDLEIRAFRAEDLDGAFLAIVATNSRSLNERVYHEAQRRGVLCNVVDVPDLCDFFYPAVVRRGDLQIAVSTSGQSPSLAQKIRQQLEKQFGTGYAAWVAELGETRKLILASDLDKERKLDLLHSLASREALEAALAETPELATKGEGA